MTSIHGYLWASSFMFVDMQQANYKSGKKSFTPSSVFKSQKLFKQKRLKCKFSKTTPDQKTKATKANKQDQKVIKKLMKALLLGGLGTNGMLIANMGLLVLYLGIYGKYVSNWLVS